MGERNREGERVEDREKECVGEVEGEVVVKGHADSVGIWTRRGRKRRRWTRRGWDPWTPSWWVRWSGKGRESCSHSLLHHPNHLRR